MTETIPSKKQNGLPPWFGCVWIHTSNQETDMPNLNRRALVAGAAALPAIAIPAMATEADPIFAAIQAHRDAWTALGVALKREPEPPTSETEALAAWERGQGAAHEIYDAAEEDLFAITPTTLAGLRALAQYAQTEEFCADDRAVHDVLAMIVDGFDGIVA